MPPADCDRQQKKLLQTHHISKAAPTEKNLFLLNFCLSSGAIRIPLALHAHVALSRYRLFAICAAL